LLEIKKQRECRGVFSGLELVLEHSGRGHRIRLHHAVCIHDHYLADGREVIDTQWVSDLARALELVRLRVSIGGFRPDAELLPCIYPYYGAWRDYKLGSDFAIRLRHIEARVCIP